MIETRNERATTDSRGMATLERLMEQNHRLPESRKREILETARRNLAKGRPVDLSGFPKHRLRAEIEHLERAGA